MIVYEVNRDINAFVPSVKSSVMMILYIVLPWIQENIIIRHFINCLDKDKENLYCLI